MEYISNEELLSGVKDEELLAIEAQAVDDYLFDEIMDWESNKESLLYYETFQS